MGKIYGFCRVACFARTYGLLGKFKLSSWVKSSSRYISSIKCFFVLLLFGISLQCTTSVPTTGAWQWALKDANETVWSLLLWWLVLNLMSVSKWQLQNWLKPFCARWFQRISFVCLHQKRSKKSVFPKNIWEEMKI